MFCRHPSAKAARPRIPLEHVFAWVRATGGPAAGAAAGLLLPAAALADEPRPWQLWHQPAATTVMEQIDQFHQLLFWIMTGICLLVSVLIVYVLWRFNAARNPVPSRTSHNTLVEVVWTVLPVLILVVIAVPSFKLLYFQEEVRDAEMTLKITGHQWYWEYQYPDHDNLTFSSIMIPEEDLQPGQRRLLEVDNRVVLPVDTNIRLQFTAGDVLHAWTVPVIGVKMDNVPGRINESWARLTREGVFYGQCSEICGLNHAYMPIAVEAVSKERFAAWLDEARQRFATGPDAPIEMAATKAEVSQE